jgi:hypothetical protein
MNSTGESLLALCLSTRTAMSRGVLFLSAGVLAGVEGPCPVVNEPQPTDTSPRFGKDPSTTHDYVLRSGMRCLINSGMEPIMSINRREFILLTAAMAAGCGTEGGGRGSAALEPRSVDAGPASSFAADGVYDRFRDQGFFVIRNGEKLSALSAICTHRACKLTANPDHSFF